MTQSLIELAGRVERATGPKWFLTKDGDRTILALYERHYSAYSYRDGRERYLFGGPGEKIVLRTDAGDAGFLWRRFRDDSGEIGINCAFFRNEGPIQSSELVRQADAIADLAWPGARHYTYVDKAKVRGSLQGACFVAAGWKILKRKTKSGKRILERKRCSAVYPCARAAALRSIGTGDAS